MAWIDKVEVDEATGAVQGFYDSVRERAGYVAEVIQLMSLDVDVARASLRFYVRLMKSPNALEPARREMLAAVVSNINECHY